MLHDDGTVKWYGFGSSLSFLHRARRFFSFSKRERKEWGRKTFWQRKKRMGSKKRFFGRGGRSEERADRGVRPYMVRREIGGCTMCWNCSQTLIRLLRRHLPRRGRQSAAAGMGGQGRPPLRARRKPEEAGGQSRPPLRVRQKIGGCTDVLQLLPDPHPSASQTPSPEGKAIRCGGDGQGAAVHMSLGRKTARRVAPGGKTHGKRITYFSSRRAYEPSGRGCACGCEGSWA